MSPLAVELGADGSASAATSKLARKTQVTGFFSYGLWSNDEPLQPFTINSAIAPMTLPRTNADAEAHVFSTNVQPDVASHHRLAVRRAPSPG